MKGRRATQQQDNFIVEDDLDIEEEQVDKRGKRQRNAKGQASQPAPNNVAGPSQAGPSQPAPQGRALKSKRGSLEQLAGVFHAMFHAILYDLALDMHVLFYDSKVAGSRQRAQYDQSEVQRLNQLVSL